MLTYAMGDIHGCKDVLVAMWGKIAKDAGKLDYKIVMLGDYVDRGPDSKGVIDFILANRRPQDVFLMGNHEDMMLSLFEGWPGDPRDQRSMQQCFFMNGGQETLASYGATHEVAAQIPGDHLEFLSKLRMNYMDSHRYFVHAGVHPMYTFDEQSRFDRLWIRNDFLLWPDPFPLYVVHGHTPVFIGADIKDNRCNLDGGGVFGGKRVVGVFDDTQAKPIDVLEIL